MRKYVTGSETASEWFDARATDYLARTVHEQEPQRVKTGLLNADGRPLFRVEESDPIGFVRFGRSHG